MRPTSNLRGFGDKSVGASFIQIRQTVRDFFGPPTQRGNIIGAQLAQKATCIRVDVDEVHEVLLVLG